MILRGNFYSKMLGKDSNIAIALPNNFRTKKAYPAVYLLHGLMSDAFDWLDNTMLNVFVQEYGVAVIMPEGGRSFYTDMRHGGRYFGYITKELPLMAQNVLNISKDREQTAIIGGSMGGFGALKCALSFPEQYGFCGAIASGALYLAKYLDELKKTGDQGDGLFADFEAIYGENFAYTIADDLPALAKSNQNKIADMPEIYSVCGKQDTFLQMNAGFAAELKNIGYNICYEEIAGTHDWYFFNDALKLALARFANKI